MKYGDKATGLNHAIYCLSRHIFSLIRLVAWGRLSESVDCLVLLLQYLQDDVLL